MVSWDNNKYKDTRNTLAQLLLIGAAIVLSLFVIPPAAIAAHDDKDKIISIVSFSFPPILHETSSGGFSGTMGETVKMLCETANIKCEFRVVPLKRAYQQLRAGDADALITINIGQLNDCCIPSDWASPWSAGFFSSAGEAAIPKTQEDLKDKSLIVVTGMKSPYSFAPALDQMATDRTLTLFKAPKILSAVKMFLKQRAPLLWGGEDFKWYLEKLDKNANYIFKPKMEIPVVTWIRRDKPEVLAHLNRAYEILSGTGTLDKKNLLIPSLMERRYVDAPFKN